MTRYFKTSLKCLLCTCTALMLTVTTVNAQDPYGTTGESRHGITPSVRETARIYDPHTTTVWMESRERYTRKDFQPNGIRIGSMTLTPFLEAIASHDDNVFATNADRQDTFRTDLSGGIGLKSNFARHILDIDLAATHSRFTEFKSLDHTNMLADVRFRIDVNHGTAISGTAKSHLHHEDFTSAERPADVFEAVPIWTNSASINFLRNTARLNFGAGLTFIDDNFQDVRNRDGDLVDQDERDNREFGAYAKFGYRFSPGYEGLLKGRVFRSDNYGAETVDRSFDGVEALAGVDFEVTELFKVTLLGGFQHLRFEDESVDARTEGTFDARVRWLITPLITINMVAGHQTSISTLEDTLARSTTNAGVSVEYKIWRNLILDAGAELRHSSYIGAERTDDTVFANLGLQYLPNRNLKFTFDYDYEQRMSSVNDFDFNRNVFRLGGTLYY